MSAAIIGFVCDLVMINLYIASVKRFFCLFNVDELPMKARVVKYLFYYTMVPLFITRMLLEMFSIIAWNIIVFGELTEKECWVYVKQWIGFYLKILGFINDFIPNYACLVILWILSIFGSRTSIMLSS